MGLAAKDVRVCWIRRGLNGSARQESGVKLIAGVQRRSFMFGEESARRQLGGKASNAFAFLAAGICMLSSSPRPWGPTSTRSTSFFTPRGSTDSSAAPSGGTSASPGRWTSTGQLCQGAPLHHLSRASGYRASSPHRSPSGANRAWEARLIGARRSRGLSGACGAGTNNRARAISVK